MSPGFEEVMSVRGRGMPEGGEVTIKGSDPVYSARFKIGEATANILAGVGVAVTDIHDRIRRRPRRAEAPRPSAENVRNKAVLGQAFSGAGFEQSGMALEYLTK